MYIRCILAEGLEEGDGWEDPGVVMFKQDVSVISDKDETDDEEDDEDSDTQVPDRMSKGVQDATELASRDTYGRGNTRLSSFKPTAPGREGGPASGRNPGGKNLGVSPTPYNAIY